MDKYILLNKMESSKYLDISRPTLDRWIDKKIISVHVRKGKKQKLLSTKELDLLL